MTKVSPWRDVKKTLFHCSRAAPFGCVMYGAAGDDATLVGLAVERAARRGRRARAFGACAILAGGGVLAGAAFRRRDTAAPVLAAAAPFYVAGVHAHAIDASEAPWTDHPFGTLVTDVDLATGLCAEYDDDASFPSAVCDCGDARTQCRGDMDASAAYRAACFDAACGAASLAAYDAFPSDDAVAKCAGLERPAWGAPCGWQAIRNLPRTCAGSFSPEAPEGASRDSENAWPGLDAYERYALGYADGFGGPCHVHAYCFTCRDDAYAGGVDPYCRAVFAAHGGGAAAVPAFFDSLDAWCAPDVLADLAAAAAALRVDPSPGEA